MSNPTNAGGGKSPSPPIRRPLKISLAMIAKNEEKRIARSLKSVQYCVGEMIVVDTGSTDGTKEIARSIGATVLDYPFQGDFSAARNFSISACREDWILVLDADEFFPISPRFLLEAAVEEPNEGDNPYKGFYILRHNYENGDQELTYSDYVLRLFRNRKGVQYRHRVHETPEESLDPIEGRLGTLTAMPISHYLFDRDQHYLDSKRLAYVAGLLKDIEENPTDASRYDFLGCEYVRMGRLADAERSFQKWVELAPDHPIARESLEEVRRLISGKTWKRKFTA